MSQDKKPREFWLDICDEYIRPLNRKHGDIYTAPEFDDLVHVREVVEPDLQFINHKSQHSDDAARDAELKEYMNINDFESALRTRSDKGSIYTNAIIIGWLEDTFKVAWNAAMKHVRGDK